VLPVARPEVAGRRRGAPKKTKDTDETSSLRQRHHLDRRADRLADEGKGNADELLTQQQVADWLGVCEQWMLTGRSQNYGPVFVRPFPEVIRYRRGDVVKWLRTRARLAADGIRLNQSHQRKRRDDYAVK
jgi:hypothetical protein